MPSQYIASTLISWTCYTLNPLSAVMYTVQKEKSHAERTVTKIMFKFYSFKIHKLLMKFWISILRNSTCWFAWISVVVLNYNNFLDNLIESLDQKLDTLMYKIHTFSVHIFMYIEYVWFSMLYLDAKGQKSCRALLFTEVRASFGQLIWKISVLLDARFVLLVV